MHYIIIDPILLGSFLVPPGDGVLRVNQRIYNMVATGLSKAHLEKNSDLDAGIVQFYYTVKRLHVYVDYELDGYCLLMPIWGKGKGVVVMDDVQVFLNATIVNLNGYNKITDFKVSFNVSGGSFDLSSLFGENPPGFWTILYLIYFNSNAKYIFNEILPPYNELSAKYFISSFEPILNLA
ncbi:hypothetical protein WA026_000410 [Henosepilachna vigintioctopunctata]|uniref:Uncharacterized protein n=1 Tax=Henosepilachna vigintioctopunctata TaxID=420089 RepID=A0AAW1V816_9CUCU